MRNWKSSAVVFLGVLFCVAENVSAQSKKVEYLSKDSVLYEAVRKVDSLIIFRHPRMLFDSINVSSIDSSVKEILDLQKENEPCFGKKRNARLIDDYVNSVYVFLNYSDFRLLKEVEIEKPGSAKAELNKKVASDGNKVGSPRVQAKGADEVNVSSSNMETVNDKKEKANFQNSDAEKEPKPEMVAVKSTKTVENWSVFYEPVAMHRYLEKYLEVRRILLKKYRIK